MSEGQRKPRLLLVDDEEVLRRSMIRLIEANKIAVDVIQAETGDAAIAILDRGGIDIVFTDQSMPGAKGTDVIKKAREVGVRVYAVMSGYHRHEVPPDITCFPKPFNSDDALMWLFGAVSVVRTDQSPPPVIYLGDGSETVPPQVSADAPAVIEVNDDEEGGDDTNPTDKGGSSW